jgi:ankyrin repeat protein
MVSFTSLLIACQQGHVEVVRLLISEGADKEKAMSGGRTPLLIACIHACDEEGRVEMVRLLISEGAGKEKAMSAGCTPLMVACH